MNLKTAARRLGVHYQTAYRYVRSGELIAVKVGIGYEVSEAAVEQLAARLAVKPGPSTSPTTNADAPTLSDVERDLDTLTEAATLSAQPIFDAVTKWLAVAIGDAGVLRILSEDGQWLQPVSSYHRDPQRRALLDAMLHASLQPAGQGPDAAILFSGRPVTAHHIHADMAIRHIPPQFRQYAPLLITHAVVAVPVITSNGSVRGVLSVKRGANRPPFKDEVVAQVQRLARAVAAGIERVERFSAGWVARGTLLASVERLLELHPTVDLDDIGDVLLDLLDERAPEAVFALDRRLMVANDAFTTGFGMAEPGPGASESATNPTPVCPAHLDDAVWRALLSGTTDFVDAEAHGCAVACPAVRGVHWAVAHRPDGTPAAVVAAAEPDGWSLANTGSDAADHEATDTDPPLCWGVCITPRPRTRTASA